MTPLQVREFLGQSAPGDEPTKKAKGQKVSESKGKRVNNSNLGSELNSNSGLSDLN